MLIFAAVTTRESEIDFRGQAGISDANHVSLKVLGHILQVGKTKKSWAHDTNHTDIVNKMHVHGQIGQINQQYYVIRNQTLSDADWRPQSDSEGIVSSEVISRYTRIEYVIQIVCGNWSYKIPTAKFCRILTYEKKVTLV